MADSNDESDSSGSKVVDFSMVDETQSTDSREKKTVALPKKDWQRRYLELLDANPLATKSVTGALLGAFGAILGGTYFGTPGLKGRMKKDTGWLLDVVAYTLCGAIQGPLGHYW